MSLVADIPELVRSPEAYPIAIDVAADRVRFVRLTEAEYRAASFLDGRLRKGDAEGEWLPWGGVREAAKAVPVRCHFLFHISHVGSTLLARLLGEHPRLFSLREPVLLRLFADAHPTRGTVPCPWEAGEYPARLSTFLRLCSRTFAGGSTSVVKATSFVSEIAGELMAEVEESRAVCLTVTPQTFLKTMLNGAMADVTGPAERRLARLHRRLGGPHWRAADLSPGACVAMSWLCETAALQDAADRFPGRVLWADFDLFLAAPAAHLGAALGHLGVAPEPGFVDRVLAGPIPTRYAKAPDHAFDAGTREQLLRQAERAHLPEIRRGLEWLRAAARFPLVHRVLETAARRQADR